MAETTIEALRRGTPDWPDPVNFAERYLAPLRVTMDQIVAAEARYANCGEVVAQGNSTPVTLGDWYKMIRWTLGYHRGAAVTPAAQQEIINAHAAHINGASMSHQLFPGQILSHFGTIGETGSEACADGHTKLMDYAMTWFVEQGKQRHGLTWDTLYQFFTYMAAQADDTSNAREGMGWINAMLAWMSVQPLWRASQGMEAAAVLWRLPGQSAYAPAYWDRIGAAHKLRRRAVAANLNVGDILFNFGGGANSFDVRWYKPGTLSVAEGNWVSRGLWSWFTGPGLLSSQHDIEALVAEEGPAGRLRFIDNERVPEDKVSETPTVDRLSFELCEITRPGGYTMYNGLIMRTLTDEENEVLQRQLGELCVPGRPLSDITEGLSETASNEEANSDVR